MKERANRLYELRKSRNLTQTAVAFRLNLSLSRISAYENGENIPCDILRDFAGRVFPNGLEDIQEAALMSYLDPEDLEGYDYVEDLPRPTLSSIESKENKKK